MRQITIANNTTEIIETGFEQTGNILYKYGIFFADRELFANTAGNLCSVLVEKGYFLLLVLDV